MSPLNKLRKSNGKYHENVLTATADGVSTAAFGPDFLEAVGLNDAERGKNTTM